MQGRDAAVWKEAQQPHELFLFNLLFNHVLLFIASVSAPSAHGLILVVPALSVAIMAYTLWRARQVSPALPLVHCHWQLAARRTLYFAAMWIVIALWLAAVWLFSGGHPQPVHFAVAGLAFFPSMAITLTLVLMESESLQHARHGRPPRSAPRGCRLFPGPPPAAEHGIE